MLVTKREELKSAQRKNWELLMLERCKDAVDLHARLNRYLFISIRVTLLLMFGTVIPLRCMHDLASVMNAVFLVTTMSWTICVCSWMLVMEKVLQ